MAQVESRDGCFFVPLSSSHDVLAILRSHLRGGGYHTSHVGEDFRFRFAEGVNPLVIDEILDEVRGLTVAFLSKG